MRTICQRDNAFFSLLCSTVIVAVILLLLFYRTVLYGLCLFCGVTVFSHGTRRFVATWDTTVPRHAHRNKDTPLSKPLNPTSTVQSADNKDVDKNSDFVQ